MDATLTAILIFAEIKLVKTEKPDMVTRRVIPLSAYICPREIYLSSILLIEGRLETRHLDGIYIWN